MLHISIGFLGPRRDVGINQFWHHACEFRNDLESFHFWQFSQHDLDYDFGDHAKLETKKLRFADAQSAAAGIYATLRCFSNVRNSQRYSLL